MNIRGDAARESLIYSLCKKLKDKIDDSKSNPELTNVLKEFGRWAISELHTKPRWVRDFSKIFEE